MGARLTAQRTVVSAAYAVVGLLSWLDRAHDLADESASVPQVRAVYGEVAPGIGGRVDDPCWSQAARLEGFCIVEQARDVPEETLGPICVGSKAIYDAFECKDRTPGDIPTCIWDGAGRVRTGRAINTAGPS